MELTSKVFEVYVRTQICFRVDHATIIDRYKMGKRETWFYMHEVKEGLKISHLVILDNSKVWIAGDMVLLQGESLEDILSYFKIRDKVIQGVKQKLKKL